MLKSDIADAAVIGFKSEGMELIAFISGIMRHHRKDSENFKKQASAIHDTFSFIEQKRFPVLTNGKRIKKLKQCS